MKHFSSKKGDLSLSTNAIVILILAITILGLGLTFVRGLFKQAESKITEVTSATEIANPPTRDNPMTLSPSQLSLRQSEIGKILVAYLNLGPGPKTCQLNIPPLADEADSYVVLSYGSASVEMDQDRINLWTIAVNPKSGGVMFNMPRVYRLKMECPSGTVTSTKDVIITVTS